MYCHLNREKTCDKPVDSDGFGGTFLPSFWTDQCHIIIHHPDPNGLVLFMVHRVLEGEMSSLAQTDPDRGLGRKVQILGH
jgi:hypothetical protein